MNVVATCLFTVFVWLSAADPATEKSIIESVRSSLATGNAELLSTRFAKNIELVIDAEKVEFSSVQATHAEIILRSFFRKYPPHGFQFVYRGSADRLRYTTGTYETNGQTFAVYILMRQTTNQQYVINTLHFRKE